jgi:hypothetical protein
LCDVLSGGLVIVAMGQLPRGFEKAWHFKDIFREIRGFLKDFDSF